MKNYTFSQHNWISGSSKIDISSKTRKYLRTLMFWNVKMVMYFRSPRLTLPHYPWSRVIRQRHPDCLKAPLPTASAASSHASRKAAPSRFRPLQRPKQKCPSNSRCLSRKSRRWWLRLTQSLSGLQGELHTIHFLSQYNHVECRQNSVAITLLVLRKKAPKFHI